MKPVFEIIPEAIFFQQTNLICQLSKDGFYYIFENDVDKKFHGLFVFYFKDDIPVDVQLKEIFTEQSLLSKNYKKVFITYSGEENALLPEELYQPEKNESLLNTLFGDRGEAAVATALVADKKIYNVYRVPLAIHRVMTEHFPLADFNHQYSLLIKQSFAGDVCRLIFYKDTFIVVLFKAGELQVIQMYPYRSATEVVYQLLNICHQFNVKDVPLQIGGMIDNGSDLYKEVNHYFTVITFDLLPAGYGYTQALRDLPSHYFSHLFSLALCV